ncbi:NADPH-dependent FMN reductase [Nesterenkonia natronophila]|uniref:NAD(P)H-dependent oxidoreductase n=1 Tax=Nesterenkonia natronophila TaxID=2174932 RepID=A0A3A4FCH0_9MICC|nr:NADPH-dependent FMN reductase [Nesterenkonia natronophila]RJN32454.1 NAD(P)H-dependent oxidoreductase [Nesterenkonia natronophila]
MVKIGYMIGSFARDSINRKLAGLLLTQAPRRAALEEIEISQLPIYDRHMDEDFPEVLRRFKEQVAGVDGLLIVSPEHNQSFPAAVKNAVDVLSRPRQQGQLKGLAVGIAGASTGRFATINSQAQMRQFLPPLGVKLMGSPLLAIQVGPDTFSDDGTADERTTKRAKAFIEAFVEFTDPTS